MNRGDAAAATWRFRGDERGDAAAATRLFRWDRVAASPRPRRGDSMERPRPRRGYSVETSGDAAAATWRFRGDAAAATRIFRGDERRRRGRDVEIRPARASGTSRAARETTPRRGCASRAARILTTPCRWAGRRTTPRAARATRPWRPGWGASANRKVGRGTFRNRGTRAERNSKRRSPCWLIFLALDCVRRPLSYAAKSSANARNLAGTCWR